MRRPQTLGTVRTVALLAIFALYLVLAMGITLLGSGVYSSVTAAARENSTQRTALSYVVNQVRRGGTGSISLGDFEGVPALAVTESGPEGSTYITYIYCQGGQLRELYTEAGSDLLPQDGIPLLELAELEFEWELGLLTILARDAEGHTWTVSLQAEEVGAL